MGSSKQPIKPAPKSPRARDSGPTDAAIRSAVTWEDRGLVCMRVLASGAWDATVPRLLALWDVTEPVLSTLRRAGKVALAAISDDDAAARYDATLAGFRLQADECEALAKGFESRNRPTLASRYRDLQRKAEIEFAEIAGLRAQRVSISLEADPRVAGMYQAILAGLEDFDRMRSAFVAEVEKLTGGALPAAPLPSAVEHVRDAVKRYEAEIGARKLAA